MTETISGAKADPVDPRDAMEATVLDDGRTLLAASTGRDLMVLFLRHSGCTFCREALADLRDARRAGGPAAGMDAVVVQQGTLESGRAFVDRYDLADIAIASDPERTLYRAFDLRRGTLWQLFGPRVWWRGLVATLRGHFVGKLEGDGFQMPGLFVVRDGRVVRGHRHVDASERVDFNDMCRLDLPASAAAAGAAKA